MSKRSTRTVLTSTGLILTAALATACSSAATSDPTSATPSAPSTSASASKAPQTAAAPAVAEKDGYVSLAAYEADKSAYAQGDVVLFFNASWCSTCQEANRNFDASEASWPNGLTVVKVDYDDNSELKQKYGVTVQHTFVQISPDGSAVNKWTGSNEVAQIEAKV